ncbi:hypothetical protein GCM10007276_12080 [Agaricicola taiwanensis]|uniref:Uncharacterized protein n=1 Tax=Agaricicola taiwanensis TaxID=591372 RepID=A0A8J2YGI7_9RHOB|nr:hypothetical protein GCM10007276_12080 [Agaricicola taiwanensis]
METIGAASRRAVIQARARMLGLRVIEGGAERGIGEVRNPRSATPALGAAEEKQPPVISSLRRPGTRRCGSGKEAKPGRKLD